MLYAQSHSPGSDRILYGRGSYASRRAPSPHSLTISCIFHPTFDSCHLLLSQSRQQIATLSPCIPWRIKVDLTIASRQMLHQRTRSNSQPLSSPLSLMPSDKRFLCECSSKFSYVNGAAVMCELLLSVLYFSFVAY